MYVCLPLTKIDEVEVVRVERTYDKKMMKAPWAEEDKLPQKWYFHTEKWSKVPEENLSHPNYQTLANLSDNDYQLSKENY